MEIKIYLSGSIKKGVDDTKKKTYWTAYDMEVIKGILAPKYDVTFLNPASRGDDLSDYKSALGRDFLQVYISDLVIVDARDRKGIGIGSEMTFAKLNSIPVITVSPRGSQYNRTNFEYLGQKMDKWIHPFVGGLSDYLVESVEDAATLILNKFPFDKKEIKGNDYLYDSMKHYIDSQMINDEEMYSIVKGDSSAKTKIMHLT